MTSIHRSFDDSFEVSAVNHAWGLHALKSFDSMTAQGFYRTFVLYSALMNFRRQVLFSAYYPNDSSGFKEAIPSDIIPLRESLRGRSPAPTVASLDSHFSTGKAGPTCFEHRQGDQIARLAT